MSTKKDILVPESQSDLDKLKLEVSNEIGVKVPHGSPTGKWGHIPAEKCGDVGGNMVKKMVESFERGLVK